MKKILLLLCLCFYLNGQSQSLYFPPIGNSTWDTISPQSLGWCVGSELDSLYSFLGYRNSKAFLLLKDGKIVFEKYYGSFTADSNWYWASAGKTLTAMTVGIAQENGLLSINDKTSQYLGNGWTICTALQEDSITIKHQLTMSTGLEDNVPDDNCMIDTCLFYKAPVNTRWAYHNAPYRLLQDVIDSSTPPSFNAYVNQKIRTKIGMNGLFYDYVNYSTPRSMARFGLLMLAKGKWDTTTVLADTNYFHAMTSTSQNQNLSYGYLTWLNGKSSYMLPSSQLVFPGKLNPNAPDDMYAAIGKDGQLINVVPSTGIVLIRMGNNPNDGSLVPTVFNTELWSYLNAVMCAPMSSPPLPKEDEVRFYPNPSHDVLHVEHLNLQSNEIRILNLQGQVVLETKRSGPSASLNVSSIQPGIYALSINGKKYKLIIH